MANPIGAKLSNHRGNGTNPPLIEAAGRGRGTVFSAADQCDGLSNLAETSPIVRFERRPHCLTTAPPYGPMCRDPKLCAGKGYCPRDPVCGD